jgi:1-hydroxycarotenoid 3,4-desaturase
MKEVDVVVVGGGVGAMCAAALVAKEGHSVRLLEASERLGGKAGSVLVDGAELDTGPSVLTLPHVLFELFDSLELPASERFTCLPLNPGFRYVFPGGGSVLVFHEVERTLDSVSSALGSQARAELCAYLAHAGRIWAAAAPHFVFNQAPEVGRLFTGGLKAVRDLGRIDAFHTLTESIQARVKTPELRAILQRYATYNGSDARRAPGTLGCIAHVELTLGGFGVEGGMRRIVDALTRCLERVGVEVVLERPVSELTFEGSRIVGVKSQGTYHRAKAVVLGADPWQWIGQFPGRKRLSGDFVRSMSAYNSLFKSTSVPRDATPHTVLFPQNYEQEFYDIFDKKQFPTDPAVYICAGDRCHGTTSFSEGEPLFTMVNAPALEPESHAESSEKVRELVRSRLIQASLLAPADPCVWSRSPEDLAQAFPGSHGALYGPAASSMWSAFRRLPNRLPEYPGVFLASGSVHPGGGVPLAVQSGKLAANQLCAHLRGSR